MLMRQTMIQGRRRRAFDFRSPTRAVTFKMRNTVNPENSAQRSNIRIVGSFNLWTFLKYVRGSSTFSKQVRGSSRPSCSASRKETSDSSLFGFFFSSPEMSLPHAMPDVLVVWEMDFSLRLDMSLTGSDPFVLVCLDIFSPSDLFCSPSETFVRIQVSLFVSNITVVMLTQTSMMMNVEKRRQQRLVRWQRDNPAISLFCFSLN